MDVRVGLWRKRSAKEFELWCWRRLLRVPWTARRSNQSILKEISPGISLKGMMLKLKLQYFATSCEELTHWKRLWCWEGLGAGGKGDERGWDGWMASLTRWMWVWVNSGAGVGDGQGGLACCYSWGRKESDTTERLNWTEQWALQLFLDFFCERPRLYFIFWLWFLLSYCHSFLSRSHL